MFADTLQRAGLAMTVAERLAETLVSVGFVLAVGCLWALDPPHAFSVLPAMTCMAVLALATRVRFDTPLGFTVPTQLAFVPLLFALPVVLVPIAVVLALGIAQLPAVLGKRGERRQLLMTVGNSWFAVGPVAVFALAGSAPGEAHWWLLLAALAAQFVVDFAISAPRFAIGCDAGIAEQLGDTWVYLIDAAFSGMGLVVAE